MAMACSARANADIAEVLLSRHQLRLVIVCHERSDAFTLPHIAQLAFDSRSFPEITNDGLSIVGFGDHLVDFLSERSDVTGHFALLTTVFSIDCEHHDGS